MIQDLNCGAVCCTNRLSGGYRFGKSAWSEYAGVHDAMRHLEWSHMVEEFWTLPVEHMEMSWWRRFPHGSSSGASGMSYSGRILAPVELWNHWWRKFWLFRWSIWNDMSGGSSGSSGGHLE
ncbi:hypothetical protein AVEN_6039-1 [Araneus ventricosus]|uniref:Uncharacterized protein n=1 Tax=Araneus ventricosus TaxID=182803 RepID=A0A4Y2TXH8_ARAVE|nr:hypothetical protein AVEN_6039-1 [Araneus ventricosus]